MQTTTIRNLIQPTSYTRKAVNRFRKENFIHVFTTNKASEAKLAMDNGFSVIVSTIEESDDFYNESNVNKPLVNSLVLYYVYLQTSSTSYQTVKNLIKLLKQQN